jgi:cobaltochelatase CobT
MLIVISDGGPVDDSTHLANDPEILERHLKQTIAEIQAASDFRLAAIGVDHHVSEDYADGMAISAADDLAKRVIPVLEDLFKDRSPSPIPS